MDSLYANTITPFELIREVREDSVVNNRNRILESARGSDFVCFSDDDVDFTHGWDGGLLTHMVNDPTIGQAGPRLMFPDGKVCSAWVGVEPECFKLWQVGHQEHLKPEHLAIGNPTALCGCVTIFSKAFLDSVDWTFDNQYETSQFEDIDQTLTVRKQGFRLLYNGTVQVIHDQGKTSPRDPTANYYKLRAKWWEWVRNNPL